MGDCRFKILYVTQYAGYMGANRSLLQLIIGLQKRYDIKVAVLLPEYGEFTDLLQHEKINFYVVKTYPSVYAKEKNKNIIRSFRCLIYEIINILILWRVSTRLRKEHFDCIHTNTSVTNVGSYLGHFLKIPHIWHVREFAKQHYKLGFSLGYSGQFRLMNILSDKIIVISRALYDYYSHYVNPKKLTIIYNGIEVTSVFRTKDHSTTMINIVVVGLLHPSKNQNFILKAINKVINEYGRKNIHLHIVGGYDQNNLSYFNSLLQYVKDNKLNEYVTFHGYIENIRDMLCTMDIGILASSYEAFGRVTVEYMMYGLVPIVSNSGANMEIVENAKTGLVFNIDDISSLAGGLVELVDSLELRRQLSQNAMNYARKNFTSEIYQNRIIELYKNIITK